MSPWVSQDISFDGLKASGVPHVGFSDAFLVVHSCYASGAGSIFHPSWFYRGYAEGALGWFFFL